MKDHPGEWLFVMAGRRLVAMTPEAYAAARVLVDQQPPDAWEELRAKGGATADMVELALQVLVDDGDLRVEMRDAFGSREMRWPVYSVPPSDVLADGAHPRRAGARRAKRARAAAAPDLKIVAGGAAE